MQAKEMSDQGRRRVDPWLILSTFLLLGLSVLFVFSTTAVQSREFYGDSTAIGTRHLFHILLGLVAFFIFSTFPLDILNKLSGILFVGTLILLLAVVMPGIGHVAGGARRWLVLGPLRLQPGELAKVFLVLYFASYIGRHHQRMSSLLPGALIPFGILGVVTVFLLAQPDFGAAVVILSVVFCQLLTSSRLLHLLGIGMAAAGSFVAFVLTSPYRLKRFQSFLNPLGGDSSGSGYQLKQSLIAVGSGGLTGAGLGAGKQKLYYLPAAHTDFIFAVIAEELGLIGALLVVILFAIIAFRGLVHAKRLVNNPFLSSLCVGYTLLIVLQAMLNIGVVLGVLPTKGLVLPLVAYGGTAMVVNLAMMGVLVRLSKMEE